MDHSSVSNNNVIHLGSFLLLYAYIIAKRAFLVNQQKVVLGKWLEADTKIIICTYRTFLMLSDDYYGYANPKKKGMVKKYKKTTIPFNTWGTNRCIILDESHKAKNPKARISTIRTSSPVRIEPYRVFLSTEYGHMEKRLYLLFKNFRELGEWFRLDDDELETIDTIQGDHTLLPCYL